MALYRVISGGQTGVDQAALRAASHEELETGGWAPKGWRTEAGPALWLKDYGLKEHASEQYPPRTELNVEWSNATLIMGNPSSPGCTLTRQLCRKHNKPFAIVRLPKTRLQFVAAPADVVAFIKHHDVAVLNVAGNREEKVPGIGDWAYGVLLEAFRRLRVP